TVLAIALHALTWHRPNALGEVDFVPSRAKHFATTRGGESQELKRTSHHGIFTPQCDHAARNLLVRNRREMLNAPDLAAGRQQVLKVTAPSRRVLAIAQTARLGPIKN